MMVSARTSIRVVLATAAFALAASVARAEGGVEKLEIDTASGPHVYQVEMARTDAEREKGLMFRRSMAPDHGMLFDFPGNQPVAFWMKDTYIPLDMIFIGRDGHVVSVARDAKPMDETIIPSNAPTTGVLELNAGAAKAIDLEVGDEVKHPIFHNGATGQ